MKRGQRRAEQRGNSALEFALALPVLMLILVGTIDLGRLVFAATAVDNAARVGAQYAAQVSPSDTSGIQTRVMTELTGLTGLATGSNPTIATTTGTDNSSETFAEVTVTYVFTPFTRLPGLPSQYSTAATARMRTGA